MKEKEVDMILERIERGLITQICNERKLIKSLDHICIRAPNHIGKCGCHCKTEWKKSDGD